MTFISTKNVTINHPTGRPTILKKGIVVTKSQLKKLNKTQIRNYLTEKVVTRDNWTDDECQTLAFIYNGSVDFNMKDIVVKFRESYDTHTDASIELMVQQAKNIDNLHPAEGMCHLTQAFVDELRRLDPLRYV